MVDLQALLPTKISRNLKGKYMLFYGLPKVGKTTLVSSLPKCLLLAFEPGYNALNNKFIQPITKWTEAKSALQQLKFPAVQEKFDFIAIDTTDWAWDLCVAYVCTQNDVQNIGDIPYGETFAI